MSAWFAGVRARSLLRLHVVAAVVLVGLLADGGVAEAHPDATQRTVAAHLRASAALLDRVLERILSGVPGAGSPFAASRTQLVRAQRELASIASTADTARERVAAVQAGIAVLTQLDENAGRMLGALEPAKGRLETRLAEAVAADLAERERTAGVLSDLHAAGLPEAGKQQLATALAALHGDQDEELQLLARTLASDEVGDGAREALEDALAAVEAGLAAATAQLQAIAADLPESAQQGITTALETLESAQQAIQQALATAQAAAEAAGDESEGAGPPGLVAVLLEGLGAVPGAGGGSAGEGGGPPSPGGGPPNGVGPPSEGGD